MGFCGNGYHPFSIYGDYMKLPPEKDRVAHGVKILKCRNIWEEE
jgi:hypothetical protein